MATRGEVIVRVQWADPERSGQRTLRLRARSLEHACRRITGTGNDIVEDTGQTPPATRPSRRVPRRRSALPSDGDGHALGPAAEPPANGDGHSTAPSCAMVEGTVEWVGEVPAGHLLPALTLVRARTGPRQIILRLHGTHEFGIGTRLYLSGVNGAQTLFDAELLSGAGKPPFFFEVHAWRV